LHIYIQVRTVPGFHSFNTTDHKRVTWCIEDGTGMPMCAPASPVNPSLQDHQAKVAQASKQLLPYVCALSINCWIGVSHRRPCRPHPCFSTAGRVSLAFCATDDGRHMQRRLFKPPSRRQSLASLLICMHSTAGAGQTPRVACSAQEHNAKHGVSTFSAFFNYHFDIDLITR
jgi:hypothetical protein